MSLEMPQTFYTQTFILEIDSLIVNLQDQSWKYLEYTMFKFQC